MDQARLLQVALSDRLRVPRTDGSEKQMEWWREITHRSGLGWSGARSHVALFTTRFSIRLPPLRARRQGDQAVDGCHVGDPS